MEQTSINSEVITSNTKKQFKALTSGSIANFSTDSAMMVTINNVTERVPKYDLENEYARVFDIGADGTFSDVDITIEFEPGKKGNAILRYRSLIPKC